MNRCVDCLEFVTKDVDGQYRETSAFRNDRPHIDCLECGQQVVCQLKGICPKCDRPVHAITDWVSVGSCGAPYSPYEIIFDLNYPENFVHRHEHQVVFKDGQCMVRFGILDHADDADYMRQVVTVLASLLPSLQRRRLLFHCFAGYSRSVVAAAAFLALNQEVSTVAEGVERIRHARKYIGPNVQLMNAAETAVQHWKTIQHVSA